MLVAETINKRNKKDGAVAADLFELFLEESQRLMQVVGLSAKGISIIRTMPKVEEALAKVKGDSGNEKLKERALRADEEAKLAERECDDDFPLLHGWAIIGLWALLEDLIKGFIAEWLKCNKSARSVEEVKRLKIRLGEYESVPKGERYLFVAELLEKEIGAGARAGTTRFEALLRPFGLSGEVPEIIQRLIFEMGQVRNLIAHRGGRVDRAFKTACPWMPFKIGSQLTVSRHMWRAYYGAVHIYVTILICRAGSKSGKDMTEHFAVCFEGAAELASNQPFQGTPMKRRRP